MLSLIAFAANSILCRLALDAEKLNPIDFTAIRLASGAITLGCLVWFKYPKILPSIWQQGSNKGALALLVYALAFSYAYIQLNTATGALILFASVQFTMLIMSWLAGKKMRLQEHLGIIISAIGFIYFVYPELDSPNFLACLLMIMAGIAWGAYSLIGAQSSQALLSTAGNFIRLLPMVGLMLVLSYFVSDWNISLNGWIYSLSSGALASGLGYAIWYLVLPQLKPSVAAVSQLSVPIWAALGGVLLVGEAISLHLSISAIIILGGILLVILAKSQSSLE
ncbi:DMT family transporter [Paraglaciecola aestuariivivens]